MKGSDYMSQCETKEEARLRHVEYSRRYRKEHPGYAKECKKKWQEDNKEYLKEYYKKYQQEHKEKIAEFQKKYREIHSEYLNEYHSVYNKKYSQLNPGKTLMRVKKYQKTEKGKACMQRANTKRRIRGAEIINTLTSREWLNILEQFKHKCAYCGVIFSDDNSPTKDHIFPISAGGENNKDNVVPACMSCNAKKNNMLDEKLIQLILRVKALGPCYD